MFLVDAPILSMAPSDRRVRQQPYFSTTAFGKRLASENALGFSGVQ
jgi:hypothetical protein